MGMGKSLLVVALGSLAAFNLFAEPQNIEELERNLSEASNQSELNMVSANIGIFWDNELKRLERIIEDTLSDERSVLFRASSEAWTSYRLAQTTYEASESRGGSIMPLVTNLAFTEITKQRIRRLVQAEDLDYSKLDPK